MTNPFTAEAPQSRPSYEETADLLRALLWIASRHQQCADDPEYSPLVAKLLNWADRDSRHSCAAAKPAIEGKSRR